MNFRHSIFKETPPNELIRRFHFSAVTTRQQYISWCKARALAVLATGDRRAAISSMLYDLAAWEDGELFDAGELAMQYVEATFYTTTLEDVRMWIAKFH